MSDALSPTPPIQPPSAPPNRRTALIVGGAAAVAVAGGALAKQVFKPTAAVFVARHQRYDGPLAQTIRDGFTACEIDPQQFRGKRVLLKPNLVEPARDRPQMTTNPAVIVAAIEVFRGWGATVEVGEAPGHIRDSQFALDESLVGDALRQEKLEFSDLNYQATAWRANRGRFSTLDGLFFPESVAQADFVVSMPKMKTHHWVGVTCSMKNLYGVLPGLKYGWPKNVLHHHGIPETVLDINATLPRTLAIVDGIDCMEGDGPILGSLKHLGLLLLGPSLPAVDATAARIMGFAPEKIQYLAMAADKLGPIADERIKQRGEAWRAEVKPFRILDAPHLKQLLAMPASANVT